MIRRLTTLEFNDLAVPLLNATIGDAADDNIEEVCGDQKDKVEYWGYFRRDILVGVIGLGSQLSGHGRFYLGYFAVHPQHQGEGIGHRLFIHFEKEMRKRHVRMLVVETYDSPKFEKANKFYVRHGCRPIGRIEGFLKDGSAALYYEKEVKPCQNRPKKVKVKKSL